MSESLPVPGWYTDPADPTHLRYWDGGRWTDHRARSSAVTAGATASAAQPAAAPAQSSAHVPGADTALAPDVLVVTANEVAGHRITAVLGDVCGLTVRSRNMFSDIGAQFRSLVGGEVKGYTQLLASTRAEAVARMRVQAEGMGANAVVAFRFDTGSLADNMTEVAAYGTAVRIEPVGAEPAPAATVLTSVATGGGSNDAATRVINAVPVAGDAADGDTTRTL